MKNNYHTNDFKSVDLNNNLQKKYKKLKRDKNETNENERKSANKIE